MHREETHGNQSPFVTRRRFVQGISAGAALAVFGWKGGSVLGETAPLDPQELTGTHFELAVDWLAADPGRREEKVSRSTGGEEIASLFGAFELSFVGYVAILGRPMALRDAWPQQTLAGHTSEVTSMAISADGRIAVSASYDTTLRVWELASGACARTLAR